MSTPKRPTVCADIDMSKGMRQHSLFNAACAWVPQNCTNQKLRGKEECGAKAAGGRFRYWPGRMTQAPESIKVRAWISFPEFGFVCDLCMGDVFIMRDRFQSSCYTYMAG